MAKSSLFRLLGLVVLILLGAGLARQIVTSAISARYEEIDPEASLRWRPDNGRALAAMSEEAMAGGSAPQAAGYARRALERSPIEARAFRVLGQMAGGAGDTATAGRLMAHAGKLTRRDPAVSYWLFREALMDGRYSIAFLHADALMRRAPRTSMLMLPELADSLADPRAVTPLAQRLAAIPPWRADFLRELSLSGPAYPLALELLGALAETDNPPTPAELSPLFARMARSGAYDEAYRAWRTFLPAAARVEPGGVYDGAFKRPPGPAPFGWQMSESTAGEGRLDPEQEGPGLQVRTNSLGGAMVARQLLLLAPGHYRLYSKGRLVEGRESALEWQVRCVGGPALARVRFEIGGEAQADAAGEFDVPQDCKAQQLILSTMGAERTDPALARIELVSVEPAGVRP